MEGQLLFLTCPYYHSYHLRGTSRKFCADLDGSHYLMVELGPQHPTTLSSALGCDESHDCLTARFYGLMVLRWAFTDRAVQVQVVIPLECCNERHCYHDLLLVTVSHHNKVLESSNEKTR